jgi:hypothetical protein
MKNVRTLGRIVSTRDLTPAELAQVSGGDFYEGFTVSYSGDCYCGQPSQADDCLSDG